MTSETSKITKFDNGRPRPTLRSFEDIFDSFRRDIENSLVAPSWPTSWEWRLPSFLTEVDTRTPLCDMVDKGEKYEISLEVPGIPKEKIDIKATKNHLEVSGEQEKKTEEKGRNYVYNERAYKSFNRHIPIPEEVIPSKIDAKMEHGILHITLPKKMATKVDEETKVQVK
ncbi:MAG: Hsp20/alpha crystallin family protein [Nitrososphaeraceae archaeon]